MVIAKSYTDPPREGMGAAKLRKKQQEGGVGEGAGRSTLGSQPRVCAGFCTASGTHEVDYNTDISPSSCWAAGASLQVSESLSAVCCAGGGG